MYRVLSKREKGMLFVGSKSFKVQLVTISLAGIAALSVRAGKVI